MKEICGCCEGLEKVVPLSTANRPYLDALSYRVGTHATFLETMVARITDHYLDIATETGEVKSIRPLQYLRVHSPDDPSIAMMDAWAVVADVLTFYQERIANEGYLGTATERRSILELARLVGYNLQPGVSASVFLAFNLEKGYDVTIDPGMRVQSLPGPGELPQSFETSEPLEARTVWNSLGVRLTQPQNITLQNISQDSAQQGAISSIYLDGIATRLQPNDLLLFLFNIGDPVLRQVEAVDAQAAESRTVIILQSISNAAVVVTVGKPMEGGTLTAVSADKPQDAASQKSNPMANLLQSLLRTPSLPPASPRQLQRSLKNAVDPSLNNVYGSQSDISPQLLLAFSPELKNTFYPAWLNATFDSSASSLDSIQALRIKSAPFGHNAPLELVLYARKVPQYAEWSLAEENTKVIYLDAEYDRILPQSWVVIERPMPVDQEVIKSLHLDASQDIWRITSKVVKVRSVSRARYGITGTVTKLTLDRDWLTQTEVTNDSELPIDLSLIRGTTVYAQSEKLTRAEEKIKADVCKDEIELDGLYDGLRSGRWLIVSGERADIISSEGAGQVKTSELVMLAAVGSGKKTIGAEAKNIVEMPPGEDTDGNLPQRNDLPDDKTHTFLKLSQSLAYCYRRDTVSIYANVTKATHGETRSEILGSGDAGHAHQEFQLRQSPLTYLAAATPAGAESTLQVRVDNVLWHETDSLAGLEPVDRNYITTTDDNSKTAVVFGNGEHGSRLPTGVENVRAVYRSGIGKPGNAKAGQISLLATRPLGVKGVINPLPATGGADRENRDQARRNVPLAVLALDRLVSVQDYADFARTFAGIGKARAARLSNGRRQTIFVTIAGAEDIPIDYHSDLYQNLLLALHKYGDPHQQIRVEVRELMLLVISARVRIKPDYLWDKVEPVIKAALLDTFSFERRDLGQDVLLSEVISTIQGVAGVDYVDVDVIAGIPEKKLDTVKGVRRILTPEEIVDKIKKVLGEVDEGIGPQPRILVNLAGLADKKKGLFQPDQIAYLTPDVPDTLILTELKS